jgi:hypothetical protein
MTMKFISATLLAMVAALSVGCGGGGGGGGGGGAATGGSAPPADVNVASIQVGAGPFNIANLPMVSVTVCAPGDSSRCYTLNNILLDTGSVGLRIVSSALASVAPNLTLPAKTDVSGNPLFECSGFLDGSYAWGAVRSADIKIAGEVALAVPIQVIGDIPSTAPKPSQCTSSDASLDLSVIANLGANGILGVYSWIEDCGGACTNASNGFIYSNYPYFTCASNSCVYASAPLTAQVKNPVAGFATDNNGIIVQLPAVPNYGSASASGSLIFGIGTRANNALGNAHLFNDQNLTTTYKNAVYAAFIDSGSNALYFDDASIPNCNNSTFFCPTSNLDLSAVIGDDTVNTRSINFNVGNTQTLAQNGYAFSNLAGSYSFSGVTNGVVAFDWGLPFFFGRSVYFGMEGSANPLTVGF